MDNFETLVKNLKGLPVEEKDAFIKGKKKQCICNTCPTYTQCSINEKETGFCLVGKSFQCISFEKGCICDECSVYTECGFTHKKFCTQGDEKGQRYAAAWVTA